MQAVRVTCADLRPAIGNVLFSLDGALGPNRPANTTGKPSGRLFSRPPAQPAFVIHERPGVFNLDDFRRQVMKIVAIPPLSAPPAA